MGMAGASTHKTTTTVKHHKAKRHKLTPAQSYVAWCHLGIGESKADVVAQMGKPHGTKAERRTACPGVERRHSRMGHW